MIRAISRAVGTRLDELAADIRAHAALAHSYSPRAKHEALVAATRSATARACRAWDAACLADVGADPRRALPPWPRAPGMPRGVSPVEIGSYAAGEESEVSLFDALADECRRWAREWDAWRDGEQRGAA